MQTALKELSEGSQRRSNNGTASIDPEYNEALQRDPVRRCRNIVNALRKSDIRRKGLAETIEEGNNSPGGWNGEKLRVLQLLRDVETRWSSTFLMIDRVLELYPVRYTICVDFIA